MSKAMATILFDDEYPRGGRPGGGVQREMQFMPFYGWGRVTLLRFDAEIEDIGQVYYILDARLTLPDSSLTLASRSDKNTKEIIDAQKDADAQYRAIERLRFFRDTIDSLGPSGLRNAVKELQGTGARIEWATPER